MDLQATAGGLVDVQVLGEPTARNRGYLRLQVPPWPRLYNLHGRLRSAGNLPVMAIIPPVPTARSRLVGDSQSPIILRI